MNARMKHKYSYINWRDTSYKTYMASCLEKMCARASDRGWLRHCGEDRLFTALLTLR